MRNMTVSFIANVAVVIFLAVFFDLAIGTN